MHRYQHYQVDLMHSYFASQLSNESPPSQWYSISPFVSHRHVLVTEADRALNQIFWWLPPSMSFHCRHLESWGGFVNWFRVWTDQSLGAVDHHLTTSFALCRRWWGEMMMMFPRRRRCYYRGEPFHYSAPLFPLPLLNNWINHKVHKMMMLEGINLN